MDRRHFIAGLGLITAPAIVRARSLMPVRGIVMPLVKITTDFVGAALPSRIERVTIEEFLERYPGLSCPRDRAVSVTRFEYAHDFNITDIRGAEIA